MTPRYLLMKSLLVVWLLFISAPSFSQDVPQQPTEVKKADRPTYEAPNEDRNRSHGDTLTKPPLSVSPVTVAAGVESSVTDSTSGHKTDNPKEQLPKGRWEKFIEDPAMIFNFIIAIFTAGLFGATVALWFATRDLVRGADRTAKRQLRAYVTVPRITIRNESHPNGVSEIFIDVTIRNFGQTPARRCSYWLDICSSKLPLTSALARPEASKGSGIGVIAPSDTFTVTAKLWLLPNGGEIHSGNYAMFVHGQFSYTDAFDERQTTDFRFMRSGEGWTSDGEMEVCVEGNDAE